MFFDIMTNNKDKVKSLFSEKIRFRDQASREACISTVFNSINNLESEDNIWHVLREKWPFWSENQEKFKEWYDNSWLPKRSNEIRNMIGYQPHSFLDVGFGDGSITSALCHDWNIRDKSAAYGIEISNTTIRNTQFSQHIVDVNNISWNLPIPSEYFDVILILNTLHHAQDYNVILDNSYNYLKKGGLLLVREHDVANNDCRDFMNFVDLFFYKVVNNCELPNAISTQNYKSANDWIQVIEEQKFSLLRTDKPLEDSLFMQTDMLFIK